MFSSIKESYYKSFNNKSRAAEFIQLASVAVKAGFANKELSKQIGIKRINDALFAQIKHHADYGANPGESANYGARSQRGRRHNEESLVMFISHLLETSTMSASNKKKDVGVKDVDVPVIERSTSKYAIISSYERTHPNNKLSTKEYYDVINCLAPSKDKMLGALDTSSEINGRQNFRLMRLLIARFKDMIPGDEHLAGLAEEAQKMVDLNEEFLKSADGLRSKQHLGGHTDESLCQECDVESTPTPANHCMYYLLGKRDPRALSRRDDDGVHPCGHRHEGTCEECEQIYDLMRKITEMRNYIDVAKYPEETALASIDRATYGWDAYIAASESRAEEMMGLCHAMGACLSRYLFYYSHRAKLINESRWEAWVTSELKKNPQAFAIECDWAMKYLSKLHREMQAEFFGKRGILWFGSRVMWYDEREQKLKHYFTNQISSDNTEDAYSSIEQITATLKFHKERHPELNHDRFHLRTDGAFYFTSVDFTGRLVYLKDLLGIKCLSHCKGEAGGGKCSVDGKFGCSKNAVDDLILRGGGSRDVNTASDLVLNLQEIHKRDSNNIPNTYSFMVAPNYNHVILKSNMAAVDKNRSKMGSSAMRKFDEDGNKMHVYYSSFLDRDESVDRYKPDYTVNVKEIWGDSTAAEIVPIGNVQFDPRDDRREGIKMERSEKMVEEEKKLTRREARQANRRRQRQRTAEAKVKRQHCCDTPGCVRQYKTLYLLNQHKQSGKHCFNGSAFRQPKKMYQPTRYTGINGDELYATILQDVKENPNYRPSGIAAAKCTIKEGAPTVPFGKLADAQRIKWKVPEDIVEAIKGMTELGASEESRKKINHHDMRSYLKDMGLDSVAATFPTIQAFSSNNNTRKYHEFQLPFAQHIKSISLGHLAKLKKQKEAAAMIKLETKLRGRVMVYLLTTKGDFSEDEAIAVANELIHRGVGESIATTSLIQKDLKHLPIAQRADWPKRVKKSIVDHLKTDLSKVLPKMPHDFLINYEFVPPNCVRIDDEDEDQDDQFAMDWIDDDEEGVNVDDEDDDDDDTPDGSGLSMQRKLEFERSRPVDALKFGNPLDTFQINNYRNYIGKTFIDKEEVTRKRKGKHITTTMNIKYKVSNVCIYLNDPSTFFFEYYNCEKFHARPNELKNLEYTEVVEFGRDMTFDDK